MGNLATSSDCELNPPGEGVTHSGCTDRDDETENDDDDDDEEEEGMDDVIA